jgi:hypothetical protein
MLLSETETSASSCLVCVGVGVALARILCVCLVYLYLTFSLRSDKAALHLNYVVYLMLFGFCRWSFINLKLDSARVLCLLYTPRGRHIVRCTDPQIPYQYTLLFNIDLNGWLGLYFCMYI